MTALTRWPCYLLVFFSLMLGACTQDRDDDEGGDDGGGHPPAEMLGSWDFDSATVDGTPTPLADALDWHPQAVSADIQIMTNGAYAYQEVNGSGGQLWSESGFIFVDGDELDMNVQHNTDGPASEMTRMAWTIDAGVFTLEFVESGETVVLTLLR